MFRATPTARLIVALVAVTVASIWAIPNAQAGGGPPRSIHFDLEAVYVNCVDDEVDEPGIDGGALVRVRLTNNSPEDVVVADGSWRVVADGVTLVSGEYLTPADLQIDATWEQVVHIPGDTGPAWFATTVDVTGAGGTSTFGIDPSLGLPGDCPQPEEDEATTTTEPTPEAVDDIVVTRPRFTG
jgi:hypothetical protein